MNTTPLLYHLYLQSAPSSSPLRRLIETSQSGRQIERNLLDEALVPAEREVVSLMDAVGRWRQLFAATSTLWKGGKLPPHADTIALQVAALRSATSSYQNAQLIAAYDALLSFLLNLPQKAMQIVLAPNGSCPQEAEGYRHAAETPFPLYHAETATLWCLLGHLSKNQQLIDAAAKAAQWQLHTLDGTAVPFAGLFAPEGEICASMAAMQNALLFRTVAAYAGTTDLLPMAKGQETYVQAAVAEDGIVIPPHAAAITLLLPEQEGEEALLPLPEIILDRDLALVGMRSSNGGAAATLYGGRSGLGCLHHGDVKVLSFGPQHLPLGDCKRFGIEGGARFLAGEIRKAEVDSQRAVIEGVARMAPAGFWIDCKQTLTPQSIDLEGEILSVYDPLPIAFSFFVRCGMCRLADGKMIRLRSFDRYQGQPQTVRFEGKNDVLELCTEGEIGQMHVVPLGGGTNFWGADYLVAFELSIGKKFAVKIC